MAKKSRKKAKRTKARFFKKEKAARAAAAGHWDTHIQYVRKVKGGYALYRYKK